MPSIDEGVLRSTEKRKSQQQRQNDVGADLEKGIGAVADAAGRFGAAAAQAASKRVPGLEREIGAASKRIESGLGSEMKSIEKEMGIAADASKRAGSEFGSEIKGLEKEMNQIKAELPRISKAIKRMTARKVDTKGLVLPNLPLADQVSELERIIEGLNENIFNTEQMSIISDELTGLQQVSQSTNAKGEDISKSLLQLRDNRLDAAVRLIQGKVN